MKKYVAHSNVLGLGPGDTFSSDDQFYADIAKSGIIEEVKEVEETDEGTSNGQHSGAEEGAGGSGGDSRSGRGRKGPGQGEGTLRQ